MTIKSKNHPSAFLALVNDAKKQIQEMTQDQLNQYIKQSKDFCLIDVREESEWHQGGIPGAMHIGKGILEAKIESIISDKQTCIILYCGGGYRSALSADNLQKMGYTHVYSLIGGYRDWYNDTHS